MTATIPVPSAVTKSLVIGVDGGGTKTVAWVAPLAADAGTVFGRGLAGPGNPRAAGFETAQANIAAAIAAALADAKLPQAAAEAACFGLAGAGRVAEQDRIAAWATQANIARRVRVTGDAEPILAAASPDHTGIALICGTGSLAWGRNAAGEIARCGGWGYLLGDEGSAYQIAREALAAAMRASDGRGPATTLLSLLQQSLGVESPDQLIERVYSSEMSRERLAQLAAAVFSAASRDTVAGQIIAKAAQELGELIVTLARQLHLEAAPFPLALAGSVIINQSDFREHLIARLNQAKIRPEPVELVAEPVAGAVALARRLMAT